MKILKFYLGDRSKDPKGFAAVDIAEIEISEKEFLNLKRTKSRLITILSILLSRNRQNKLTQASTS